MIQNARPMVERIRSPWCSLMSVMGVTGMLKRNGSQLSPSSRETNMPNSVPAYSRPGRTGSSRIARVGKSEGIPLSPVVSNVQLSPKFSVL